ncbi:MAG: ATP-binding cassette domain-containing protein [Rhodobiaceae bacterium]|nr:ATP-binding cassette domain-containing protein [Rhodobiaceae bacterium]
MEFKRGGEDTQAGEPQKGRARLRPLAQMWPYVARYKGRLIAALVALLAASGATLIIPVAVRRVIDHGFSRANAEFVDQYFAVMMAVVALLAVASASRFYFVTWLGERVVSDVRSAVFAHILNLSPSFYDRSQTGEVISRLTADTTQIKAAVGASMSIALRNLFLLIGAMVMMVVTSPRLSGLVLGAIPIIVLPLVGFGRSVRRRSRLAQDTLADATSYASETISSVRAVQAFNHERASAGRFAAAVETAFGAARASITARAGLTFGAIFLVFASVVGVLWYGAQDVLDGRITGGQLSQFVLYSVFAAGAMGELSQVWGEVSQASGAAERLSELLAIRPAIKAPANPQDLPDPARGEVAFEDVGFAYETRADAPVVEGVSFSVAAGETVAIVGPSGAGKSTLFHLLLRFYDPSSGTIRVDGVELTRADPAQIRARMAIVPQETAIFAASIGDNIRFGRLDASDEDVRAAARAARVDEFVDPLPEGFDTLVGERGVTLSGGQRQRIAIARAILKDAPILLLDEATSALDAESEKAVQEALEVLMQGRTTLVIAHRLATVKKADRILVMEDGRIVEQGSHGDLAGQGGLYSRLAKLQFSDQPAA